MIIDPLEEHGGNCVECGREINGLASRGLAFRGVEMGFSKSNFVFKLCNRCLTSLSNQIQGYLDEIYEGRE